MTGERTSNFGSDAWHFFTQCNRRCLEDRRALYTTNPATHAALVTGWERLLLPLCDDTGTPRYVLAYDRPLSFKHEVLARVLNATRDVIIAVEQVLTADAPGHGLDDNLGDGLEGRPGVVSEPDCAVLFLNAAAEEFLDSKRADVLGRPLSASVPQWASLAWGQALAESLRTGKTTQLEWQRERDEGKVWYQVTVNPFTNGSVVAMSDITELKDKERSLEKLNRELEQLANIDPLTGVSNRRHFLTIADAEAERTRRYAVPLSIIAIDVDHFKDINDGFGHEAGDQALKDIVQRLSQGLRANDTLGRLGGEEFSILLPHTGEAKAYELAQRLCTAVASHPFNVSGTNTQVTSSFGIAENARDESVSSLLQRADRALYEAKRLGRNRVERAAAG